MMDGNKADVQRVDESEYIVQVNLPYDPGERDYNRDFKAMLKILSKNLKILNSPHHRRDNET